MSSDAASRAPLFAELDRLISVSLELDPAEVGRASAVNLGSFDSIDLLDTISLLEDHFDVEFSREELARIVCKDDLYNLVYRKHVLERRPILPEVLRDAAVVIPVYNHAAGIAPVLEQAVRLNVPVFVVDDGSEDGSAEIAEGFDGVTVLRHAKNQGKGAALRTGMAAAHAVARWAVTLDADGQHEALEAIQLMAAIPAGTRPVVIGHREGMEGPTVPWTSAFGRTFSNFWVWLSGGSFLPDTQSGFRVYPLPEVLELGARSNRFQYEVEILALAGWHRLPVISTPITVNYRPGRLRISHFRPFVDFLRNSRVFARLIVARFLLPRILRARRRPAPPGAGV